MSLDSAVNLSSLRKELRSAGIEDEQQFQQLQDYVDTLLKWNRQFNLVSRKDISRLPRRHVLDSLAALALLQPGRVLDIGSGAGLPGLVLAIASPQQQFVLIDRHTRKVRFLQQVITQLELTNVTAQVVDLDDRGQWQSDNTAGFTNVVSRAVMDLTSLWRLAAKLVEPEGQLLAYTATSINDPLRQEIAAMETDLNISTHFFDPTSQQPRLVSEQSHLNEQDNDSAHVLVQVRIRRGKQISEQNSCA